MYCDKSSSDTSAWACKTKPYCGDGICTPAIYENCNTCSDCVCSGNTYCSSSSTTCLTYACSTGQTRDYRCDASLSNVLYDQCSTDRKSWTTIYGDTCGATTYCSGGKCVANICTPGAKENKRCLSSSTIGWSECLDGYKWVDKTQACSSTQECKSGSCVTKAITCPTGYHIEGTSCVKDTPTCSAGYHLEGTSCVKDALTCQTGYHEEGGVCVRDAITCQTGFHEENGACVKDALVCDSGYHEESGVCVKDTITCPTGFHEEKGVCLQDVVPPQPSVFSRFWNWLMGLFA